MIFKIYFRALVLTMVNFEVMNAKALEDGDARFLDVEGVAELCLGMAINLAHLCKKKDELPTKISHAMHMKVEMASAPLFWNYAPSETSQVRE